MYRPREWPTLAFQLDALLSGDGEPLLNAVRPAVDLAPNNAPQLTSQAFAAVICTDGPALADMLMTQGESMSTLSARARSSH